MVIRLNRISLRQLRHFLALTFIALLSIGAVYAQSISVTYAKYASNLLMVAMNQAAQGMLAGAPFRDPLFCQSNRANSGGEDWALTVDWIYNVKDASGNPILTAADTAGPLTVKF